VARVKRSVHSKKHRRAVLQEAKGYYGNKSRSFRAANEQVMHSLQYAYRDRRARKGDFRKLWIQRINAAAREHGVSYSRLIAGLRRAEIEVDRKVLADLAVREPAVFASIVQRAMGDELASSTTSLPSGWTSEASTEAEAEPESQGSGASVATPPDEQDLGSGDEPGSILDEQGEGASEDEPATAR